MRTLKIIKYAFSLIGIGVLIGAYYFYRITRLFSYISILILREMEKFEGQNILDFMETFPDDDACKAYLAYLKWQDGFKCSICEHKKGCLRGDIGYFCYSCYYYYSSTD